MGQSGEFASTSPPTASRGGIPRWLVVIGIVAILICALIGILVCASPVILTLLGPAIGNNFTTILAGLGCQTENPGLTAEQCSTWAEEAARTNPEAIQSCTTASSGTDNSTDGAEQIYQCLLDQGVSPP
jgi:hypothetical protein